MKSFLLGLLTGGALTGTLVYLYHRGKLAPLVAKIKLYEIQLGIKQAP